MVTHPPSLGLGIPFTIIQSLGWSILPCQGFLAQENFRDSIESYSRGVPETCSAEAYLRLVLPQHNNFQAIMAYYGVFMA